MTATPLSFGGPAPKVKQVMTPFPYFIHDTAIVEDARVMMQEHEIHHLPVQRGRDLIGIVSNRDLDKASDRGVQIQDVLRPDVLIVEMDQPLDRVLRLMMRERVGSVLVRRGEKLAGIFTNFDACRLLADAFEPSDGPPSASVA